MSQIPTKLNLGCGSDYREGWYNVDINDDVKTDLVQDLEADDWDLPSDHFEHVLVDNVFEHIRARRRVNFISECHRILAPEGELVMRLPVPDFGVGWDVTHPSIPSWKWPMHPRHRDNWEAVDTAVKKTGPGKFLPKEAALFLTRFWIARCVMEVEVTVRPLEG